MRQVPTYLVIGNGRLARHLLYYFSTLEIDILHWHRAMGADALQLLLPKATHLLLAISDRAIEPFVREHLQDATGLKIHFSGALYSKLVYGAHPLMTFGAYLYDADKYKNIPFIIDADAPEGLLPGLPNPQARIDPALKAKYHAMCVMAGNFTCMLWQKMFDTLQSEFHLSPVLAHMYLQQQAENLMADYKTALTGPLPRNDMETIAKNMKALRGDPYFNVYESFVETYARAKGSNT